MTRRQRLRSSRPDPARPLRQQVAELIVALEAIQKTQAVLVKAATPTVQKAISDALVGTVTPNSKT